MRYRLARGLGALGILGTLVLLPAAGASADSIVPGVPGYQVAYDLQSYRLQGMPPTVADIAKYHPNATPDELADLTVRAEDAWSRQRDVLVSRQNMSEASIDAAAKSGWNVSQAVKDARSSALKNWSRATFTAKKVYRGAAQTTGALIGYDMALGAVGAGFKAFGVDASGTVCNSDLSWLGGIITQTNCASWLDQNSQTLNSDIQPGTTFVSNCTPDDGSGKAYCIKIGNLATTAWKDPFSGVQKYSTFYCATFSGRDSAAMISSGSAMGYQFQTADGRANDSTHFGKAGGSTWFGGSFSRQTTSGANGDFRGIVANCGTQADGQGWAALISDGTATFDPALSGYPMVQYRAQVKTGLTPQDPSVATTQVPDPERTLTCTIHGDDGKDYTATTAPYHESSGKLPAPTCADLPDGVNPTHATVTQKTAGAPDSQLYDGDRDPRDAELSSKYATCQKTGLCVRDLISVVNGNKSCFDLGDTNNPCDGWFEDAQKLDHYKCTYGGNAVALDYCNQYRQTFNPDMRKNGTPYSNPADGTTNLKQTGQLPAGARAGELAQPVDLASCMQESLDSGDMWGIIFSPVRCALSWAFTPGPVKLQADLNGLWDAWNHTIIGKLQAMVAGWWKTLTVTGCRGPHVVFDQGAGPMVAGLHIDAYPMDACPGTGLAPYAPISQTLFSAVVAIFGTFTCIRSVAQVVGFSGPVAGGGE